VSARKPQGLRCGRRAGVLCAWFARVELRWAERRHAPTPPKKQGLEFGVLMVTRFGADGAAFGVANGSCY